MREQPAWSGWRLPLLMFGIAELGVLAGTLRAAVLEGLQGGWSVAVAGVFLLAPVAVMAALAQFLTRQSPGAASWGGTAAALVAALYTFELLHPKYNQDANIGMGLYLGFGWLFPLGPAFLVGALLGLLAERRRDVPSSPHGVSPSPAALEDAQPLPPLRPWLWPLLVPGAVSLAISVQPILHLWKRGHLGTRDTLSGLLLSFGMFALGSLPVSLSPALIALLALRGRAARDGGLRPRLAAFWGLCLGLAVTLGLFGFGQGLLQGVPLEVFIGLCALPPFLGFALGHFLSRFPKS